MPDPEKQPPSKKATAGVLIAAVCALCASVLTQPSEGLKPKPYWDPAHIRTYCYGETENVEERLYSNDECGTLLRKRLAEDYAPKIAACLPQVNNEKRLSVFAALLDASYNAGPVAVCRSPMAEQIRAGNWRRACDAFPGWYVSARNRQTGQRIVYKGLVIRRQNERALCLKGAA